MDNDRSGSPTGDHRSPLVERLRREADILPNDVYNYLYPLMHEAADEIERLQAQRDHWRSLVSRADAAQFPPPNLMPIFKDTDG